MFMEVVSPVYMYVYSRNSSCSPNTYAFWSNTGFIYSGIYVGRFLVYTGYYEQRVLHNPSHIKSKRIVPVTYKWTQKYSTLVIYNIERRLFHDINIWDDRKQRLPNLANITNVISTSFISLCCNKKPCFSAFKKMWMMNTYRQTCCQEGDQAYSGKLASTSYMYKRI